MSAWPRGHDTPTWVAHDSEAGSPIGRHGERAMFAETRNLLLENDLYR